MNTGKEQILEFWSKSVRLTVAAALAGSLALWALAGDNGRALALGLLLGTMAGVIRFRIALRTLMAGPSAGAVVRSRMIGYVISGAALLVAFLFRERISPWTTAVGLLVMNGSLVLNEMLDRRKASADNDN